MNDTTTTVTVTLNVNGETREVDIRPRTLLGDVLRKEFDCHGVHLGCEHGVCGACTVIMDGLPVRSCLMLGVQAQGHVIETVESLELEDGSLNPLQSQFQKHHGLQCGFCTPGILMSLTALFREVGTPTETQIRDYIQGHICRCTGYQQMIEGAMELSESLKEEAK